MYYVCVFDVHFFKEVIRLRLSSQSSTMGIAYLTVSLNESTVAPLRPALRYTSIFAVQVFRDSARAWSCHLYAFAAPNERALAALAALGPVLEVGAGVGYWAHLLRERGVSVVATDQLPTTECGSETVNQYHGRVPAWTNVEQAPSSCSSDHSYVFPVPDLGASYRNSLCKCAPRPGTKQRSMHRSQACRFCFRIPSMTTEDTLFAYCPGSVYDFSHKAHAPHRQKYSR